MIIHDQVFSYDCTRFILLQTKQLHRCLLFLTNRLCSTGKKLLPVITCVIATINDHFLKSKSNAACLFFLPGNQKIQTPAVLNEEKQV